MSCSSRSERPPWPEPPISAAEPVCPICLHAYPVTELTRHHLVPRSRRGKETVLLCRHCHRQIHALFSEQELERSFGTLEKLLAAEDMQPWITWIRRRQPTGRVRARSSHRKGRRR
jgi:hypothetical protein